jgi:predicted ester cyclase
VTAVANAALLQRFTEEVWNRRDLTNVEELVTEDYTVHIGGGTLSGRANMAAIAAPWFEPFPDLRVETVLRVADGDLVAEHLLFTGTHTGAPFHPGMFRARGLPPIPPTGAEFAFTQTCITRVEAGLMAETWEDFDRIRLWLQLGVELVVPTP